MTPLVPDNFLHSLCRWMVARAAALSPAVTISYGGASTNQLFRWKADEAAADGDLYSVLAIYGGDGSPLRAKPTPRVQVATHATGNKAGANRAQLLFDLLAADDGSPLRMQQIPGYAADDTADGHWLLVNVDWFQRPGLIGRDDRDRAKFVFNVEIGLQKTTS